MRLEDDLSEVGRGMVTGARFHPKHPKTFQLDLVTSVRTGWPMHT